MTKPSDSGMIDVRPSDYGAPARRERSHAGWIFLVLVLAGCGGIYQFRPQWVTWLGASVGLSLGVAPGPNDSAFATLYQKYRMTPLGTGVVRTSEVNALLLSLTKDPCDKQTLFQTSTALENVGARRGSAEMLTGAANVCPESNGERYRASELYYLMGDYATAVKLSSDVIDHQPDAQYPYYLRAKSEQSLEQYAAAIEDYTIVIQLVPDTKSLVSEVFTRMSESYEKLDRPCEAIGPIQTYIALDSEKRSVPVLLKRIAALTAKGNCAQVYAKGVAHIPRRSNGVATARVQINGVEGTFIVDTGASFLTLTENFAARVKPQMFKTDSVEMQTANGTTAAKLATVDSVKLDDLSASDVPTIITGKDVGKGVDGLLGMSLLSRFTVAIRDREIQLTAKTLGD
jgi:clan AA aspartic protease (TIGR02281 family)